MFHVINKDTKATLLTLFWFLHCYLQTYFTPFLIFSLLIWQVNVCWTCWKSTAKNKDITITLLWRQRQSVIWKKLLWTISQISHENTHDEVLFLIGLQSRPIISLKRGLTGFYQRALPSFSEKYCSKEQVKNCSYYVFSCDLDQKYIN